MELCCGDGVHYVGGGSLDHGAGSNILHGRFFSGEKIRADYLATVNVSVCLVFILSNFSIFSRGSGCASKRSDHEVQFVSLFIRRIPVLFAVQLKMFRKYCNYDSTQARYSDAGGPEDRRAPTSDSKSRHIFL